MHATMAVRAVPCLVAIETTGWQMRKCVTWLFLSTLKEAFSNRLFLGSWKPAKYLVMLEEQHLNI